MKNLYLRIFTGIVVSTLTAAMLILAFHPYNVWFLAFVAFIPMLVAQHLILPVKWAGVAPAVGIGGWLLVFLTNMFGSNPTGRIIQLVVLVIILIQVTTVPGIRRFHVKTGYRWFILHGILDWVGVEMIRSFIPPINTHAFIAQTMYTQPGMLLPMSVFSIYGLSMLIILVNFVLAYGAFQALDGRFGLGHSGFFRRRITHRSLTVAGVVLLFWMGTSIVIQSLEPEDPPKMTVAAIQHNYPRPGNQDPDEIQLDRLDALSTQAYAAAELGAQLIVMPELGLGFDPQLRNSEALRSLAGQTSAHLFIGYGLDDPAGWRNEMVLLTPDGDFLEVYGKNHPTSPGEPPIVTSGSYPVYDISQGRIATLICNDVHFTDVSRKLARNGAQLIAVPTLEGPGIALEQVAQSVMRAVENRVAIVKADVAYAAAIIDPYGRIVALRNGAPQGEAFALVAEVPLGTTTTIYSRTGDIPGWICLAGLLFFVVFQGRIARRFQRQSPNL